MKGEYSVRGLCALLGVSASGYYRWRHAGPSARQQQDQSLSAQIAVVHRASRGNYGAPRVVEELRDHGVRVSRRRCARLMRSQGLRGKKRHRRWPHTTNSRHGRPVAPNLLAKHTPTGPDQVWVTDITYVQTAEGWLFVSAILDGWSRRVVGWSCGATLHTTLVLTALESAIARRRPGSKLIHHSDRGCQYVDTTYRALLTKHGFIQSMSGAGNCYDNAAMESFWSTLKTEAELTTKIPATRRQAELAVFNYIETFYNPARRHSSLGYLSPVAFENQSQLKDKTAV
jgi:transposase InsO family protein